MEQHPIPQNIASYEFRLVGEMTLKQFVELAGGLVVALIFYASGLPFFLKWPFVFVSAILGVGLAFFPIGERPLEDWIIAFFKAVYSPTQFLWHKNPKKPEFLDERPVVKYQPIPEKVTPQDRLKMAEYVSTLPGEKNLQDQKEEDFLNKIHNLFYIAPMPASITPEPKPLADTEEPSVRVRKLHGMITQEIIEDQKESFKEVAAAFATPQPIATVSYPVTPLDTLVRQKDVRLSQEATYTNELPMPSVPTTPNVLVGMVLSKEGRIMEGVIMEVKDQNGNPVRALRTNKLGQFRTVTPLGNGSYEISLDKEGVNFDNIKVTLTGEIVTPIEIKAK